MHFAMALVVSSLLSQIPAFSASQRDSLERGGVVVFTRQMEGSPWPAVTVYLLIDATPEVAAATFIDYPSHQTYIPGVKRSRVSRVLNPATAEVDYEVSVPLVSDERYTVRDRVSATGEGGYRVDWVLVRATSTKATAGHAAFMPYTNRLTHRSGTLLEYYDFVTPGSRMAGIAAIRNRALRDMQEAARAIARYTESQRSNVPATRTRLDALKRALPPG